MNTLIMTLFLLLLPSAGAIASDYSDGESIPKFDGIVCMEHPRLFLKAGEERSVAEAVESSPAVGKMHDIVMRRADAAMSEPPVTRVMEGKRLLETCRVALKRIFALSYAWRMTGNDAYARRAEEEMIAACAFSDWNPRHFLDVGEMTMALAIGYDWLYDELSPDTRAEVRSAIIGKAFDALGNKGQAWFYDAESNWNSVCNAGIVAGALAIYEDHPDMCSSIIGRSLQSNPKVLASYAPDGGYPEGYMYWGYGSAFEIMLIAAFESACGTDFGLSEYPGFLESGRFMQAMRTPSGGCYNFSDASYEAHSDPMLFWVARRTGDKSLPYTEIEYIENNPKPSFSEDRLLPFAIVCASMTELDEVVPPAWNFWFSRGVTPVFAYRSGWESRDDTYFGIKGGTPSSGHSHIDGGSFIYERKGVRWALDLGMQNYYSLEKYGLDIWDASQDGDRWKVFRYVNMAHNTVSIKDSLHKVSARAEIIDTFSMDCRKGAVVDLSELFPQFEKVVRTAVLDRNDNLHIEDVIEPGNSSRRVVWMMNTEASPEIVSENEIRLECRGRAMSVSFAASSQFEIKILSNAPVTGYDAPNKDTSRICLEMTTVPGTQAFISTDFRLE